ncbi:NADPH:adrenodoxin oxidoreductase, mitochondrial-like [Uloborus diversus]|uniref:NADPH:adrenodoxin oxidoreductase, mitochondrial-like n=1 Tax=Uloborus diversus TaxID=327109 RepID=UPI002409608C|nr:NADPH:adrenodoxin oxidoreductase, mitochondrial-like [Uloborus diversus]
MISSKPTKLFMLALQGAQSFRSYTSNAIRKKICIVGSGPAGFYTAQYLLKNKSIEIDIFERLPVPFGLIRYGVAPDHPEIKVVTNSFTKVAQNERCNFYGNVTVGKDVKLSELQDNYHAVVLAYGASQDRTLQIPGEESKNVLSARSFVGWYNGHPDHVNEQILLDTDTAVVIGHGNVALDVARILLQRLDNLKTTDITEYAYEALKKSQVQKVVLIGRRGPLQVSFTIKELRELIKLSGCVTKMNVTDFKGIPEIISSLPRPKKRITQLMYDTASKNETGSSKTCEIKFLRRPNCILSDDQGRVTSLICKINKMEGTFENPQILQTEEEDVIKCGLVLRSVGYKSVLIEPDIPFDKTKHIILNDGGRVEGKENLFCSGWVKTGPTGVIVSTMSGSYETAEKILADIDKLASKPLAGNEIILELLKQRGVKVTTFNHWMEMDKLEQERGKALGKPRVKICDIDEMLEIV